MENENTAKPASLADFKSEKPAKTSFIREHFPFLFSWQSPFYFGVFCFLVAMAWMAFALIINNFSQLLNWDYTWQYISFTYDYWDAWHVFFTTGHFRMYDMGVFLGTDMIGSGSYYGLFDPFMFVCYLLPRAWIPHTYAVMTFLKLAVAALLARMYLKRMGISEWTSRFGALAYAFSGFTTFFEGSPNFTTAMVFLPLVLYGIEQVIREQKPLSLAVGVFLLGISCFFYVVVICIWGVIYALWRFFWTIKSRDWKTNVLVMLFGIGGFAVGLMLAGFSLLPSLRETTLSGRSSSIGTAYLHAIIKSLKEHDIRSFFTLIFEEVGDNPGREMMGMVSFFFPTGGFTILPIARGGSYYSSSFHQGYDAWTSSLFCYTPFVILFFCGIIHSIRLQKWQHLFAIVGCTFLVLTNFSYFFFYAFSGNGYGRWFLVLVPAIIYYGCWAFDLRKESPRFIPFAGAVLALAGTIAAFFLCEALIGNKTFNSGTYNPNNTTYWQSYYVSASEVYGGIATTWYFYYQVALVCIEGVLLGVGLKKKYLPHLLTAIITFEIICMGNLTYVFNGTWSLKNSYAGGESNRETSLVVANQINANDSLLFRTHSDTYQGSNYAHNVFGLNNVSSFHSLMNFDAEQFALNNQMKFPGRDPGYDGSESQTTYGGEEFYNPRWSGHYGNKRFVADTILGYRYHIIENYYGGWLDAEDQPLFLQPNVPFGAEEKASYSPNRARIRVYRVKEEQMPQLGYAVDSDEIYHMGMKENSHYLNDFYHYDRRGLDNSNRELLALESVELNGAILDDGVTLPEGFAINDSPKPWSNDESLYTNYGKRRLLNRNGFIADYYVSEDGLLPQMSSPYYSEGVAHFLNHFTSRQVNLSSTSMLIQRDFGKLVLKPSSGVYFNTDERGCYFDFHYSANKSDGGPRIYAIGDRFDSNGNLVEENACLSFDHNLLANLSRTDYYTDTSANCGLFAYGKVKYVVFCYTGKGVASVNPRNITMTVTERSQIEEIGRKLSENALQNVSYEENVFRFQTAYDAPRVVKTQLGYDAGWQASYELNGKKEKCQMLRLDGGLVGFVAPSVQNDLGDTLTLSYELRYVTPLANESLALWIVGFLGIGGYLSYAWFFKKKKGRA